MMKLTQFFQDGTGALSSTRLAFLAWSLGVLGIWAYSSIHNKALQPIPDTVIAGMGVVMGGKVVQSFSENKSDAQKT